MTIKHQKIILFNGPPCSGKDTSVRLALNYVNSNASYLRPKHVSFAASLKNATHALFGLKVNDDYFAETKDAKSHHFFGITPREAYITVSEKCIKPVFGASHFGKVAAAMLENLKTHNLFLFSDCGFAEEVEPLVLKFGPSNIVIVELLAKRDGEELTFQNDSRSYIGKELSLKYPAIKVYRIPNEYATDNHDKSMLNMLVSGICKQVCSIIDGTENG